MTKSEFDLKATKFIVNEKAMIPFQSSKFQVYVAMIEVSLEVLEGQLQFQISQSI